MNKLTFIKVLFAAMLPVVFVSCYQSTAKRVDDPPVAKSAVKTDSLNEEFLPLSEMRVCGKLPMVSGLKNMTAALGKSDSVITPDMNDVCVSYYDKKFERYHVKGITFEKYSDTVVFSSVDFNKSSATYLTFGKLKLDKTTSLSDIKKLFPVSGADVSSIKMTDGSFDTVTLAPSKTISDDSLLLFFDKQTGLLVRVSYHMPC